MDLYQSGKTRLVLRIISCLAITTSVLTIASIPKAWASVSSYFIPQEYESPRALGMGNAFISVADDYSAILYNPAGLALRHDSQTDIFVGLAEDSKFMPFFNSIKGASSSSVTDLTNMIQSDYGNHYYAGATLGVMNVWKNWGFAIIPLDVNLDLDIHQQLGPTVDVIGDQYTTFALAHAWNLMPNSDALWTLGVTLKGIYRVYFAQGLIASQLALGQNLFQTSDAQEGATVDADVGTMYTPNWTSGFFGNVMRPTFAMTVQNVGDYGFPWTFKLLDKIKNPPPKLQRRINVGTSFQLPKFWIFKPLWAIEEHDMLADNFTALTGFHTGVELKWDAFTWLGGAVRAGYSEGYAAFGTSVKLWHVLIDGATWGEEVGTPDNKKEDRRYMLRVSATW